tara:strand:- start:427 stop:591 length:165 start_codon:yes stop_codon:yes gene_type:complete
MDDVRIIDVLKEIKKLKAEISDKQWENLDTTITDRRLRHFEDLAKMGEFYEPNF